MTDLTAIAQESRGTIYVGLGNTTPEQLERYRAIFIAILKSGGADIRNGQTVLHFDHEGTLQKIDTFACRWRKEKEK